MTLDQIFRHGQEAAKHLFQEQGAIHPMWVAETENGQIIPVVVQMPDKDDRPLLMKALRDSFRQNRVVRYVAILESWSVELDTRKELGELDLSQSLEHHQDRREVIFVFAEDKDGSERSGRFYILRPEHGEPKLSEFKNLSEGKASSEGTFTKLLATEN